MEYKKNIQETNKQIQKLVISLMENHVKIKVHEIFLKTISNIKNIF